MTTAFINSTQSAYIPVTSTAPGPTRSAVWLNTLWFSALICSLASASVGIMVKQWLREYSAGLSGASDQISRLRQYRLNNLAKWGVAGIVSALPILLQLSLTLFLAGLLVLLWTLHVVVATVSSALVGALMTFTLATLFLPAIKPDCCYISPPTYAIHYVAVRVRRWSVEVLRMALLSVRSLCGWIRACAVIDRWSESLLFLSSSLTPSTWRSQETCLVADTLSLSSDQIVLAYSVICDNWYLDVCGRACLLGSPRHASLIMGVFDGIYAVNLRHDADGIPPWLDMQNLEVWVYTLLHTCLALEERTFVDYNLGPPSLSKAALEKRETRLIRYMLTSLYATRSRPYRMARADCVRILAMLTPLISILLLRLDDNLERRSDATYAIQGIILKLSKFPTLLDTWTSACYGMSIAMSVCHPLTNCARFCC